MTIRPRDGISDETITQVKKWLSKCDYAAAYLEMEDEARHLHAQIWTNTPKARGDICKAAQRICERSIKDWDTAQLKVLRSGVRIAYSDWYLDYLAENDLKTDHPNCIIDNVPQNGTMDFYPSEEDQLNLQTMKTATDPRFANLEIQCKEFLGDRPITHTTVAHFLADAMFVSRTIKVVLQQRDRLALHRSLFAYITKSPCIYNFLAKDYLDHIPTDLLYPLNIQECNSENDPSESDV